LYIAGVTLVTMLIGPCGVQGFHALNFCLCGVMLTASLVP
jgi:hypothetical protein